MTLGAPLALLGLLLVPVLLLLERIRRRPRSVVVASLSLWGEIPARPAAARRRRRRLRILLRVLAVVALSTAAAAPAVSSTRVSPRTLLVLVDRSPSMGAGDRLEGAMAVVRRAAERFDAVRVMFSPGAPVRREGDDLAAPDPAPKGEPVAAALASLLSLAGEDRATRALFVGDRAPPGSGDVPGLGVALVGRPLGNAGITDLRVDAGADGPVAFVAWRSFPGAAPPLVLEADGREVARVPGGPGRRTAVRALPRDVRTVTVRLDHDGDALAADDEARAVRRSGPRQMGLVGEDPPAALVAALRAVLGDRLIPGAPGPDGGIAWRRAPPDGCAGAWIAVRPPTSWAGVRVTEDPEAVPLPVGSLRPAPALAAAFPPGLARDVTLGPPLDLVAPADGEVLLSGADGRALAVATGRGAVLAFDPADPRGTFHTSGAHAVLWRLLLDCVAGPGESFEIDGILDEEESDLRGEERGLRPGFGEDLARTETEGVTSLRWPFAAAGCLAVLALLVLGRLDLRGDRGGRP